MAQTFTDFEVICVNDGSSDNSPAILEKYAMRDPRIRIITQKNQGVCAARNRAIAAAGGKYIYPLDSDDKIAPTCLEVLFKIITTSRYTAVCPLGYTFNEEGKTEEWLLPKPTSKNMYSRQNGLHNSTLFHKSLWEKYGGYDEEFRDIGAEDFDFFLNFIDDNQPVCQTSERLFYYRQKSPDESRNLLTFRHNYAKLKETLFAKRPFMRLWHDYYLYAYHSVSRPNTEIKLFGILPLLKIRRKINKTTLRAFNFMPLLSIEWRRTTIIYRLFDLLPLLSVKHIEK
ncbi:hypothetical protein FACS1894139_10970 [Planctomycetales bacterium]|nr:hypothetical protein FACS1894139_10970 [Planctomycetales bacterium]